MDAEPLTNWINERHAVYIRKSILEDMVERGLSKPHLSKTGASVWGKGGWSLNHLTDDPIIGKYRFCNCFRELDRVTVWIRENIREPYADHEHLWFMLAIARFINWPPTLDFLIDGGVSWPSNPGFRPEMMTVALESWKHAGNKVETGAYMIRAESDVAKYWYSWSKQRYVSEIVLGKVWANRVAWRNFFESGLHGLQKSWETLREQAGTGWGPFMAGQVVADLRWTRYLRDAPDVGLWAPVGPGSTRGLNRLAGRPLKQSIGQEQALVEMRTLQAIVNAESANWVPRIELHDLQNCLCETDKYLRVKSGEGTPRSQYVPGRGS